MMIVIEEDSLVQLKLKDAALGNSIVGANNGREMKFQENKRKLRHLVLNYRGLKIEKYLDYAIQYYNNDLFF